MGKIIGYWKQLASFKAIRKAIRIALTDPVAAFTGVLHGEKKVIKLQVKRLMRQVGANIDNLEGYWEAVASKHDLHKYILAAVEGSYYGELLAPESLYIIVRMLKPEIVVETGVAAGISSAFILQALQDNNRGRLYSIDFPNYALKDASPIPEGKEPGFAIPPNLKRRWVLELGKSSAILPNLLAGIGKVDIFLHDSEHSYENMMFEYTTSWDYLPPTGLLLSHDISWNSAFRDFSRKVRCKPTEIYLTNIGAIAKKP